MNLKRWIKMEMFRIKNKQKEHFECPICIYRGPFRDITPESGLRLNAKCAKCGSLERHRLQYLVVTDILKNIDVSRMTILHVAPEGSFRRLFRKHFGKYESADLYRKGVDHNIDLQYLPFDDAAYDFLFASHVLEHIPDDRKALKEISRVLKPGGIAILPVPVHGHTTIEYTEAIAEEHYHVRAPGIDYFDRFNICFSRVDLISSDSFSGKYQLYVCADKNNCSNGTIVGGRSSLIEKRPEIVPVCYN